MAGGYGSCRQKQREDREAMSIAGNELGLRVRSRFYLLGCLKDEKEV